MSISDLVFIDSTGYHYADYPTFLLYYQQQYQTIYGTDVYLGSDSQDGQWVAVQAQAAFDLAALGAANYNSYSPSTAQGVGLSRQVQINGLQRNQATFSTVDVAIGGTVGTPITNGVAQDSLNQLWNLPTSVTIPMAGTITVTATSQIVGAIDALPNTVTTIYTPTAGWQTVNNPSNAAIGDGVESDAALRNRQAVSTSLPALSVFDSTLAAVANVSGVELVSPGYENPTGSTDANGVPAHSISIVVEGGDALAIATAIANKKTPGTGTYGTTTETVIDSRGIPNVINFYRPTLVTIDVAINLTQLTGFTASYKTFIQNEVAAYINALGIGTDVLFTKLYIPANLPDNPTAAATFDINSIAISRHPASPTPANVVIAFNELAVVVATNIVVTP